MARRRRELRAPPPESAAQQEIRQHPMKLLGLFELRKVPAVIDYREP